MSGIPCVRRLGCIHWERCKVAGCCTLDQPDAQTSNERSFWVVERFENRKSAGYWDGGNSRSFVDDIDKAVQFCRRQDAMWATRGWHWTDTEITEHIMLGESAVETKAPACDDCNDTGQVCVGYSGRDDDGNAPLMERCPSCGYGEATTSGEFHGLDNARQVFFYEQDHYYLSNFSSFCLQWRGHVFLTSEHAYHWARFDLPEGRGVLLQDCVQRSFSAHAAFRFAQDEKAKQRADWDAVKVDTMRDILRTKAQQHEYVKRKLLATGDRELIENSWRDDFWGWGPKRDGQNMLGTLWMEIRAELRAAS